MRTGLLAALGLLLLPEPARGGTSRGMVCREGHKYISDKLLAKAKEVWDLPGALLEICICAQLLLSCQNRVCSAGSSHIA